MGDIMALLAGGVLGERGNLFPSQDARAARQVAAARDWCQTSPDHAAIEQLAATLGAGRKHRAPASASPS